MTRIIWAPCKAKTRTTTFFRPLDRTQALWTQTHTNSLSINSVNKKKAHSTLDTYVNPNVGGLKSHRKNTLKARGLKTNKTESHHVIMQNCMNKQTKQTKLWHEAPPGPTAYYLALIMQRSGRRGLFFGHSDRSKKPEDGAFFLFNSAAYKLCNTVTFPTDIRETTSENIFKWQLETDPFHFAFNWSCSGLNQHWGFYLFIILVVLLIELVCIWPFFSLIVKLNFWIKAVRWELLRLFSFSDYLQRLFLMNVSAV